MDDLGVQKKQKMSEIVSNLKLKMAELDELGKKIKMEGKLVSPRKTQQILEEIKVPSLKLLKEHYFQKRFFYAFKQNN